ncbi:hydrolase, partial [Brevibacterium paucivorans]
MRPLATYDARDSRPIIVTAESIITVDDTAPTAQAMLVFRGLVEAVGTLDHVQDKASDLGVEPELVDFGKATIVPGFIDPHAHPLMFGQLLSWVDISPNKV